MKKTDLRIIKSKSMIREAFLNLIKEKGYEAITVKDIAEKSMINRKTFYSHYETKKVLYDEIVEKTLSLLPIEVILKQIQEANGILSTKLAIQILENMRLQKETFQILMGDNSNGEFIEKLEKLLSILTDDIHTKERSATSLIPFELLQNVYSKLFVVIIKWWITHDETSPEEAIQIMFSLFSDELLSILGIEKI